MANGLAEIRVRGIEKIFVSNQPGSQNTFATVAAMNAALPNPSDLTFAITIDSGGGSPGLWCAYNGSFHFLLPLA